MSIAHWYLQCPISLLIETFHIKICILCHLIYILIIIKFSIRLSWHFDLKKFRPAEIGRVKISLTCVFAFIAIGWPLIIYKAGIIGWLKFWFMPWMGYHFWVFPCSNLLSFLGVIFNIPRTVIWVLIFNLEFIYLLFMFLWCFHNVIILCTLCTHSI